MSRYSADSCWWRRFEKTRGLRSNSTGCSCKPGLRAKGCRRSLHAKGCRHVGPALLVVSPLVCHLLLWCAGPSAGHRLRQLRSAVCPTPLVGCRGSCRWIDALPANTFVEFFSGRRTLAWILVQRYFGVAFQSCCMQALSDARRSQLLHPTQHPDSNTTLLAIPSGQCCMRICPPTV